MLPVPEIKECHGYMMPQPCTVKHSIFAASLARPLSGVGAGSGHCGKSSNHLRNFRVGTFNVNTLKGRVCKVVETLSRRKADLCCVQEIRYWGGHSCIIKGKDSRYKLFWSGNSKGTAGVGVFVAGRWSTWRLGV